MYRKFRFYTGTSPIKCTGNSSIISPHQEQLAEDAKASTTDSIPAEDNQYGIIDLPTNNCQHGSLYLSGPLATKDASLMSLFCSLCSITCT